MTSKRIPFAMLLSSLCCFTFGLVRQSLGQPQTRPTPTSVQVRDISWTDTSPVGGVAGGYSRASLRCPPSSSLGRDAVGTDVYAKYSGVCAAAVHAGIITMAKGGVVTIQARPSLGEYTGSSRNGVTTKSGGLDTTGAFYFVTEDKLRNDQLQNQIVATKAGWGDVIPEFTEGTANFRPYARFSYNCAPHNTNSQPYRNPSVWGTDVYAGNSQVCYAALHKGLINYRDGGIVTFEIRPWSPDLRGSERNGIVTANASDGALPGANTFVFVDNPKDLGRVAPMVPVILPGLDATRGAGEMIGMVTDPRTGRITTTRRNADGTTTTYSGLKRRDPDGTEHYTETDDKGARIETTIAPNGQITVVTSTPGKGQTTTTTNSDGSVRVEERFPDGSTRTSGLVEGGSIVTETRNPAGRVVFRRTEMPDGSSYEQDDRGNVRYIVDDGKNTTIIVSDRSGNTTRTLINERGETETEVNTVAPREPGRSYFEQVLHGTDWENLPQSLRNRYAASERDIQQLDARRAQEDAAEAKRKTDEARRAAEAANATDATRQAFDKLKAEQAEADRKAAARAAVVARRAEVEGSYQKARDLQSQYDSAISRGDKAEAERIMKLQDEHHERSMAILQQTPGELSAMDRRSETRTRLANMVSARAYSEAQRVIDDENADQRLKERVTEYGQHFAIGAQMQEETKGSTRSAIREKALAKAKQDEILRRLNDPKTTTEEREILDEMRTMAIMQEAAAGERLSANARMTTAGYGIDAALTITAAKAEQLAARAAEATVAKVGQVLAERAALRTSARRGVVTVVEDSITPESRILGRDILPTPKPPSVSIELSRNDLLRLFRRGVSLTRDEVVKKAELLARRAAAKAALRKAIEAGVPDQELTPLQTAFRTLNQMVENAIRDANTGG